METKMNSKKVDIMPADANTYAVTRRNGRDYDIEKVWGFYYYTTFDEDLQEDVTTMVPIVGDFKYGEDIINPEPSIMLVAHIDDCNEYVDIKCRDDIKRRRMREFQ